MLLHVIYPPLNIWANSTLQSHLIFTSQTLAPISMPLAMSSDHHLRTTALHTVATGSAASSPPRVARTNQNLHCSAADLRAPRVPAENANQHNEVATCTCNGSTIFDAATIAPEVDQSKMQEPKHDSPWNVHLHATPTMLSPKKKNERNTPKRKSSFAKQPPRKLQQNHCSYTTNASTSSLHHRTRVHSTSQRHLHTSALNGRATAPPIAAAWET